MITAIPTAEDFTRAAVSLLHLAWRSAITAIEEWDEIAFLYSDDEDQQDPAPTSSRDRARRAMLKRRQISLGNTLSLIQQAVEHALKGRIAAVSPFLLIVRDSRDSPPKARATEVDFSEFRTIDAVDLARIHDMVCAERLPPTFDTWWNALRKRRNTYMHSVRAGRIEVEPTELLQLVLKVNAVLLPGANWIKRRLEELRAPEEEPISDLYEEAPSEDYPLTWIMGEIEIALRSLTPAEAKLYFDFDTKRHAYYCPHCFSTVDHEAFRNVAGGTPALATLIDKNPACTYLRCIVCEEITPATRTSCTDPECGGNVLSAEPGTMGMCCLCGRDAEQIVEQAKRQADQETRMAGGWKNS